MSSRRGSKLNWPNGSGKGHRMNYDIGSTMEAEFDTVAGWTSRVAADLGPEYYVPAACRGSGQPEVLDWLLERLGPRPGAGMIDVRAGMGGAGPLPRPPAGRAAQPGRTRAGCVPRGSAALRRPGRPGRRDRPALR